MALQLSLLTPFGVTLSNAYAKINGYSGTKDNIVAHVDFFATQAARDAGNPVVDRRSYQWNNADMNMQSVTDADGLVSALYVWLKTLPDFTGAIDV